MKKITADCPDFDAEKAWKEIESHKSNKHEKLDLDELDSISGGADRDWQKDGCAATCEWTSWCFSNDLCSVFDITYDNIWATCPNKEEHLFNSRLCVKCGYYKGDCPV